MQSLIKGNTHLVNSHYLFRVYVVLNSAGDLLTAPLFYIFFKEHKLQCNGDTLSQLKSQLSPAFLR